MIKFLVTNCHGCQHVNPGLLSLVNIREFCWLLKSSTIIKFNQGSPFSEKYNFFMRFTKICTPFRCWTLFSSQDTSPPPTANVKYIKIWSLKLNIGGTEKGPLDRGMKCILFGSRTPWQLLTMDDGQALKKDGDGEDPFLLLSLAASPASSSLQILCSQVLYHSSQGQVDSSARTSPLFSRSSSHPQETAGQPHPMSSAKSS